MEGIEGLIARLKATDYRANPGDVSKLVAEIERLESQLDALYYQEKERD